MNTLTHSSLLTASLLMLCSGAIAQVPTYSVEVIETYTVSTNIRGASNAGHVVGDQIIAGVSRAFVATLDGGLSLLPLPEGGMSSVAMDVNDSGVIVGAVHGSGFVFDGGQPAIWTPDGNGGYEVHIPEQFTSQPSPLGELAITGGMATAINNNGTVLGWSRYQGFSGGPTTMFSINDAPVNLSMLGFQATVEDLNDNGFAVGGNLVFDLNTNTATDIGVPDPIGSVGFTHVLGYAINDSNQVVAAAHVATSTNNQWLTYIYDGAWAPIQPGLVATRFVGLLYDNNNLGDVSAWGGVSFAAEGEWYGSYDLLLEPDDQNWDTAIGYIADDRRVYTWARDLNTDTYAIVVLVPDVSPCTADLNLDGAADFFDISELLMSSVDYNGDTSFDFFDISAFLQDLGAGCP